MHLNRHKTSPPVPCRCQREPPLLTCPASLHYPPHATLPRQRLKGHNLQSHPRYLELLERVAKIHRKKGSRERADALDGLAHKLSSARTQQPRPVVETQVITSPQDILRFIGERVDPSERMRLLQELMRTTGVQDS